MTEQGSSSHHPTRLASDQTENWERETSFLHWASLKRFGKSQYATTNHQLIKVTKLDGNGTFLFELDSTDKRGKLRLIKIDSTRSNKFCDRTPKNFIEKKFHWEAIIQINLIANSVRRKKQVEINHVVKQLLGNLNTICVNTSSGFYRSLTS